MSDLLALTPHKRSPDEPLRNMRGQASATLLDFWRWASSDLLDNTVRGQFAEFIVARALGADSAPRREWAGWDLETPAGTKVEVKASGYVQSWHQERPSIIRFGIRRAKGWDPADNSWDETVRRRADVYVFCLLGHDSGSAVDPLDMDQWQFYVVTTDQLDRELGAQQSLGLSTLRQLGVGGIGFGQLGSRVAEVSGEASRSVLTAPAVEESANVSPSFDRPRIAENKLAFAIEDGFPVTPGHALVVTKRVVATWFDATLDEQVAVMALVAEVKSQLDQLTPPPNGFNVGFNAGGSAGQTVMHLHVHVIPRYDGDVLDPRGGVRHVIPSKGNYLVKDDEAGT